MAEYNGGFQSYADRVTSDIFFRSDDRYTKTVTLLAGQVVKALTPLESDSVGKYKVYSGTLAESALLSFNSALASAETIIIAGVTLTASAALTPEASALAIYNYVASGTASGTGYTVSGTLTAGYLVSKGDTNTLVFTWNVPQAGQTDLALTGTATAKATLTVSSPATPTTKIAGFAVYDVAAINAAGANTDTEIAVYSEVSLWADAIVWAADATETITLPNGSTKAVTAFNTGAAYGSGNMSVADLKTLKAKRLKLVEGTEFDCLGFRNPGDYV